MSGWVKNFPASAGSWELMAALAKQRGVLTATLVAQVQRLGARPERVCGAWMINSHDWAEVEHRLPAPATPRTAQPQTPQAPAGGALPQDLQAALDRQLAELERLQDQLAKLQPAQARP